MKTMMTMMTMRRSLVLFLPAALAGCDKSTVGTEPPPAEPDIPVAVVRGVHLADVGNAGDATDFQVSFERPANLTGIDEFRIILVPEGTSVPTAEAANALAADRYEAVGTASERARVRLSAGLDDVDGNPVAEGVTYRVAVFGAVSTSGFAPTLVASDGRATLAVASYVITVSDPIDAGTGGLDIDVAGNVYLGDFGGQLTGTPGTDVFRMTPDGTVSVWATGFMGASGNTFGPDGDFYQSSIRGHTVSRVTPDGTVSTFVDEGLQDPVGITVGPDGDFFVANCGGASVTRVQPDGTVLGLHAESELMMCPNGITHADDGNLYVSNFGNGDVVRITPAGEVSVLATLPGGNLGHLLFGNGVLYVVARGANQLYEVTLDGESTLIAGSGTRGLADGAALDAELSVTNDVALSPDGTELFFNDVAQTSEPNTVLGPVVIRKLVIVDGG